MWIGSKRHANALDEEIVEVSKRRLMGKKLSKYISSFTSVSKVPVFDDTFEPV